MLDSTQLDAATTPNTPTPPTPTLVASPTGFSVKFTQATDPTIKYYEVQRADNSGFTSNPVSQKLQGTIVTDENLGQAVQKWYRVRAVRDNGQASPWSSSVNGTTPGVVTADLKDVNVTTAKIADLAVTTAKIANMAVTTPKINDQDVTEPKLATDAVITRVIKDVNVTEPKLANNSVATRTLIDLNVTTAKLAANAVTQNQSDLDTGSVGLNASFTDLGVSITLTTTGGPVLLIGATSFTNTAQDTNGANLVLRIRRGSTTVADYPTAKYMGDLLPIITIPMHISWIDTPTAASHTYTLQAQGNNNWNAFNTYILAIELKR